LNESKWNGCRKIKIPAYYNGEEKIKMFNKSLFAEIYLE
jgi:hypothetical protein